MKHLIPNVPSHRFARTEPNPVLRLTNEPLTPTTMNSYTTTVYAERYRASHITTNCYHSSINGSAEGFLQVSIMGASCGTYGLTPDHLRELAANLLQVAEEVEAINAKIPA